MFCFINPELNLHFRFSPSSLNGGFKLLIAVGGGLIEMHHAAARNHLITANGVQHLLQVPQHGPATNSVITWGNEA